MRAVARESQSNDDISGEHQQGEGCDKADSGGGGSPSPAKPFADIPPMTPRAGPPGFMNESHDPTPSREATRPLVITLRMPDSGQE